MEQAAKPLTSRTPRSADERSRSYKRAYAAAGLLWGFILWMSALLAFQFDVIGLHSPEMIFVAVAFWGTLFALIVMGFVSGAKYAVAALAGFLIGCGIAAGMATLIG